MKHVSIIYIYISWKIQINNNILLFVTVCVPLASSKFFDRGNKFNTKDPVEKQN